MEAEWESPPVLRKTRFVCVSDTHNASPLNGCFKLPKGDVLIHAGDMTNQGSFSELRKTVEWIEKADFETKIVVAGNHDITLDPDFYEEHGSYWHNQHPQDPAKCIELFTSSKTITYLNHDSTVVRLTNPKGPQTTFKIFGSPYSPEYLTWAFGYKRSNANELWDQIPLDSDIVITHGPPKFHRDEAIGGGSVGCQTLRETLWRIRPRLAICGHIHEGRGVDRVRWSLSHPNVKFKESGTQVWEDPGADNDKMSLLDLTAKSGNPLDNDGSSGLVPPEPPEPPPPTRETTVVTQNTNSRRVSTGQSTAPLYEYADSSDFSSPFSSIYGQIPPGAADIADPKLSEPSVLPPGTRGQGGVPPSGRCDMEALAGRLGRRETCVVNCAIMANSFPHKRHGGKRYNKPIVVDIDLPVWVDDGSWEDSGNSNT